MPGNSPVPRWMARLMLSAGMFSALAAATAPRRRGFFSASPPFLAAMVISFIKRVKILPRLASSAPFLCLMVAHLEWPDMERPQILNNVGRVPIDALPVPRTKRCFRFESSGERADKLRLYHCQQCGFPGDAGPVMPQF